jgi:hypothetical protein
LLPGPLNCSRKTAHTWFFSQISASSISDQ